MASNSLTFTKMHGLGNDFIVLDELAQPLSQRLTTKLAQTLCDRRFGIGADQILWLKKPQGAADIRMEILNADGSTAEMCGNGIRAVALYLHDHAPSGLAGRTAYGVETLAGLKRVELQGREVRVDMGQPSLEPFEGARAQGESLRLETAPAGFQNLKFFEVGMGNPHAVFFVDDVDAVPLETVGPLIECHPRFPKRTNVEFVKVESPSLIRVKVWERGAGVTLACGTGACASAVATLATQRGTGPLQVELPGGSLVISWAGKQAPVMMTGPAQEVFRGEWLPV